MRQPTDGEWSVLLEGWMDEAQKAGTPGVVMLWQDTLCNVKMVDGKPTMVPLRRQE